MYEFVYQPLIQRTLLTFLEGTAYYTKNSPFPLNHSTGHFPVGWHCPPALLGAAFTRRVTLARRESQAYAVAPVGRFPVDRVNLNPAVESRSCSDILSQRHGDTGKSELMSSENPVSLCLRVSIVPTVWRCMRAYGSVYLLGFSCACGMAMFDRVRRCYTVCYMAEVILSD